MGVGSLWKFIVGLVKKPVRNYNVIERMEKTLDVDKRGMAPRHPGTAEKFDSLVKGNPHIKIDHDKKPEALLNRLKIVKVASRDEPVNVESQEAKRPLPHVRETQSVPDFGYQEPKFIPEGKCSLRQGRDFIMKAKDNPKQWTVQKIAEEYRLDPSDVQNVLSNFKPCYVVHDRKTKKAVAASQLEILGAVGAIELQPKYGDKASHSSEKTDDDTDKR